MDDIVLFIYPDQTPGLPPVASRGHLLDHIALTYPDVPAAVRAARGAGRDGARGRPPVRETRSGGRPSSRGPMRSPSSWSSRRAGAGGEGRTCREAGSDASLWYWRWVAGAGLAWGASGQAPAQQARPSKRVLVLTHNAFYKHDMLETLERTVSELGREAGFEVTSLEGFRQNADAIDLSDDFRVVSVAIRRLGSGDERRAARSTTGSAGRWSTSCETGRGSWRCTTRR